MDNKPFELRVLYVAGDRNVTSSNWLKPKKDPVISLMQKLKGLASGTG